MAYTRDTNRLFVGNISNLATTVESQQQTLGGTLVGNKYLGYIDSKPPHNVTLEEGRSNGEPLNLESDTGSGENAQKALLLSDSLYRSYNFLNEEGNGPVKTNDNKWQRLSFYNPKYDAYDGDYMYDIYRNALILFDHNIKPSTDNIEEPTETLATIGGKRKTPLQPRRPKDTSDQTAALKTVEKHTTDMYGDGYVLLYNVIPDGETLTFTDKTFNHSTGECESSNDTLATNFSYNVIKLNSIPPEILVKVLDSNYFTQNNSQISLNLGGVISNITDIPETSLNNAVLVYNAVDNKITSSKLVLDPTIDVNLNALNYLSDWDVDNKGTVNEYIDTLLETINNQSADIKTLNANINKL